MPAMFQHARPRALLRRADRRRRTGMEGAMESGERAALEVALGLA